MFSGGGVFLWIQLSLLLCIKQCFKGQITTNFFSSEKATIYVMSSSHAKYLCRSTLLYNLYEEMHQKLKLFEYKVVWVYL